MSWTLAQPAFQRRFWQNPCPYYVAESSLKNPLTLKSLTCRAQERRAAAQQSLSAAARARRATAAASRAAAARPPCERTPPLKLPALSEEGPRRGGDTGHFLITPSGGFQHATSPVSSTFASAQPSAPTQTRSARPYRPPTLGLCFGIGTQIRLTFSAREARVQGFAHIAPHTRIIRFLFAG